MSSTPTTSIPLTTTFTPSPSCLSDYYWTSPYTPLGFISLGPPSTTDCLPSGWEVTSQHFSPGLCPSGYVIACSITTVLDNHTETQATCCPSSYLCQNGTNYPWYSTEACGRGWSNISSTLTLTTITSGATFISTSVYAGYGAVNAYGISIRWQSTDFPATITQPTTALTSVITSTVTVPAGGASSHGLTSGAAAGIGVGAVLIFIAVIAFVAVFILRRRRRRRGPKAEATNAVQRESEKYRGRQELEIYTAQSALRVENDNGTSTIPADGMMHRAEGGGHGLVELPEQGQALSPNS